MSDKEAMEQAYENVREEAVKLPYPDLLRLMRDVRRELEDREPPIDFPAT